MSLIITIVTLVVVNIYVVQCKASITPTRSTTPFSLEYKPNRPFYAGESGGKGPGQLIPPGTPWPSKPENYSSTNTSTTESSSQTEAAESVSVTLQILETDELITSTQTKEDEAVTTPSQALDTQSVPNHEQNSEFTAITQQTEITTNYLNVDNSSTSGEKELETSALPLPNRPPFLGPTGGNYIPQKIPPGTPWPAKPEYSSAASQNPVIDITQSALALENKITTFSPSLSPVKPSSSNATSDIFTAAFYFGEGSPLEQSKDRNRKPTLAISFDLNAMNKATSAAAFEKVKSNSLEATEKFLSMEKGDNYRKDNVLSVWVNLEDIIKSPDVFSTRLNVSHVSTEAADNTYSDESGENNNSKKGNGGKQLLSIFINFEDFKKMSQYSSNPITASNKEDERNERLPNIFAFLSRRIYEY